MKVATHDRSGNPVTEAEWNDLIRVLRALASVPEGPRREVALARALDVYIRTGGTLRRADVNPDARSAIVPRPAVVRRRRRTG